MKIDLHKAAQSMDAVLGPCRKNTALAYRKDLSDFARYLRTDSVEKAVQRLLSGGFGAAEQLVNRYRNRMISEHGRDLAPATVNRRLSVLRQVARAAHRRGWIQWTLDVKNVTEDTVKNPDGPPVEKVTEMLNIAAQDDSRAGRRTYAILRLFSDLALRRSSITALNVGDLDLKTKMLRVRIKGHDKPKRKDLPDATAVALRRWIEVHPCAVNTPCDPVFVNLIPGRYTRLSGPAVYQLMRKVSTAVNCRTRPHGFRHTSIEQAILNATQLGETLDRVRDFSDHRDFRMVLRYRNSGKRVQGRFADANASAFGDPLAGKS